MTNDNATNEMTELKELSRAIEKLVDVHIETIKQNRDMLAAIDNLVEQNDLLIVELTEQKKDRDEDENCVTLLDGQKIYVK